MVSVIQFYLKCCFKLKISFLVLFSSGTLRSCFFSHTFSCFYRSMMPSMMTAKDLKGDDTCAVLLNSNVIYILLLLYLTHEIMFNCKA